MTCRHAHLIKFALKKKKIRKDEIEIKNLLLEEKWIEWRWRKECDELRWEEEDDDEFAPFSISDLNEFWEITEEIENGKGKLRQ